jgi:P4 family phage/plasmid primase-like protien
MLRSKASDFDYRKIPELYFQWTKHFKHREGGVTLRSLMFWAKQDVPELYENVKKNTRDYYIEQTLQSPTEFDFALVLYQMFRDKYICSNLSSKTWYVFKDHRWEVDRGQSLRKSISVEMYLAYQDKISHMMNDMQNYSGEDERYKTLREMVKKATELSMRLKKTTDKNNIMREAEVLFYDGDFERNIDSNKWLLCFKNGVVDLKNKVFRNGSPQDYLSKSTNLRYEPLDEAKHGTIMQQIKTFMSQLFPDPGLNTYMWEHLGSTLIGENKNQCFNIYRGSGSNGKSILTDLMEKALGDYYGTVPVTLVTEKRPGIGGPTSELIQLKGVRYAVMQEPSKDARINEGMMKQLTGDSKLSGRALYHEQETFMIQFHLVVCTNSLFEINSNDDGTWRRIRICDFVSKFVDEDAPSLQNVVHQFPKDKHLKDKLDDWAEIFIAMLVERAFANQGIVEKCEMVKESSNKYRQGQDHIAAFVEEKIGKKSGGFVQKSELCEQFKIWFQEEEGGARKAPKPTELYEYMEIKFGKTKRTKDGVGWVDLAISYTYENEDVLQQI